MKIQEREYEKCGTCGHNVRLVKEEEYGCNNCGKLLYNERTHEAQYLDVTIHRHGNSSGERMEFCSWHCVVERLRMVECDYFISLPFLHFDDVPEGQRAQDFFEEIDQLFPADGVWLVDYPGAGQASRISKLCDVPEPVLLASIAHHTGAIAKAINEAWSIYMKKGNQSPMEVAELIINKLHEAVRDR